MIAHPLTDWRGFRTFATLSLTSRDISRQTGLVFRSSHDDLDELKESAFSTPSGSVFGLVEHLHSPVPGVEVLAHESTLSAGTHWPMLEVLSTLRLDRDVVQWSLQPEFSSAPGSNRIVCVMGRQLDYFRPDVLHVVRHVIIDAGFDLVAPWEDIEFDARISDHIQVVQNCDFILYLASSASAWSYYDLGVARACRKPILALGPESGWARDKTLPHFDRELLLADPNDTRAVHAMLNSLIAGSLVVSPPRRDLSAGSPRLLRKKALDVHIPVTSHKLGFFRSHTVRILSRLIDALHGDLIRQR
jgi:hypothetical protein